MPTVRSKGGSSADEVSDDKHSTKTDNVHEEYYCLHPDGKRRLNQQNIDT